MQGRISSSSVLGGGEAGGGGGWSRRNKEGKVDVPPFPATNRPHCRGLSIRDTVQHSKSHSTLHSLVTVPPGSSSSSDPLSLRVLVCSRVTLRLLFWGPHLKNHCCTKPGLRSRSLGEEAARKGPSPSAVPRKFLQDPGQGEKTLQNSEAGLNLLLRVGIPGTLPLPHWGRGWAAC